MRYLIIKIILLFSLFSSKAYSSPGDSLLIKLKLVTNEVKVWDDLSVSLEITSLYSKNIFIPKKVSWGHIQDSLGFVCYQLQKKEGNEFKDYKPIRFLDNLSLSDEMDTLGTNKPKTLRSHLLGYKMLAGTYRLRVICFMSLLNDIGNGYSNWFYFKCDKEVTRF
jgi:hypothetical protein